MSRSVHLVREAKTVLAANTSYLAHLQRKLLLNNCNHLNLLLPQIEVLGECPGDFPLQKKRHSLEFLRGAAHLRPRTNTIACVARVRSALALATHQVHHIHTMYICISDITVSCMRILHCSSLCCYCRVYTPHTYMLLIQYCVYLTYTVALCSVTAV
jgi:hypothetical protein